MSNRQLAIPGKDFSALSQQPTAMDLLQLALQKEANIDVIERLAKLQRESQEMQAEEDFNDALTRCQEEIVNVVPDLPNTQTGKKYASYKAIDKVVRPVYIKHGLSLSFSGADCPIENHLRMVCMVSRGIHTRRYQLDIAVDATGPKGGAVMTKTHAVIAATSHAKRALILLIFNLSTGEDETLTNDWLLERIQRLEDTETMGGLQMVWKEVYEEAKKAELPQNALLALVEAKNRKKKLLGERG